MSTLLADHGIWSDVKIWREMIIEIIEIKIIEQNRNRKRKAKVINISYHNLKRLLKVSRIRKKRTSSKKVLNSLKEC